MLLVFFPSFSPGLPGSCTPSDWQRSFPLVLQDQVVIQLFSAKNTTTHTPAMGFLWIFGPSTGVQVDLPIAVDVCCAPIVVPDDASVPDAPASEPSEAAQAAPVEAEAVPEAAPEAAPAVGGPKAISGCPVVSIFPWFHMRNHADNLQEPVGVVIQGENSLKRIRDGSGILATMVLQSCATRWLNPNNQVCCW